MNSLTVYLGNKRINQLQNISSRKEIEEEITKYTNLLPSEFYLTQNGKILSDEITKQFGINNKININVRIFGGKGGFGSMLRAIGAQIEKTTNREACRDLSGRRLRDINEEKRLKAWLDKQKDRDAEAKERKRKKLEKLMSVPKHEFKDSEYESIRAEMTENVSDAVEEGFKKAAIAAKDNAKRKVTTNGSGASKPKKAALWFDDDISSSSDTDDDSDSDIDIVKKNQNDLDRCNENHSSEEAGEGSSKMNKDDISNSEDIQSNLKNSNYKDDHSSEEAGEGSSKMNKDDSSNSEDIQSNLKNSNYKDDHSSEEAGEGLSKMNKDDSSNSEDIQSNLKNSNCKDDSTCNVEDESSNSGGSAIEK